MAKVNKTLCFEADIVDFLKKQGNMSFYLDTLIRKEMKAFPDIETIDFVKKRFRCPGCKLYYLSDEKSPSCGKCRLNLDAV